MTPMWLDPSVADLCDKEFRLYALARSYAETAGGFAPSPVVDMIALYICDYCAIPPDMTDMVGLGLVEKTTGGYTFIGVGR